MLFSLATLTRPRIGEDLSLRSRRLTGLCGAVRRCSAAWDTATGKWAAVNSASCRGPRSGHQFERGPDDLATTRPGHAIRRIAHMNLQGAQTTVRDGETAAPHAGSPNTNDPNWQGR